MDQKPKTIREMQAEKAAKEKQRKETITLQNVSKQLVSIHLDPPKGVDFYLGAEDKPIRPNQVVTLNRTRVRMEQIKRLQQTGFILVISDSTKKPQEGDESKKVVVSQPR